MNCVGIDVSKGKKHDRRHAALRRSGGFTFEVRHTASELSELARLLKSLTVRPVW